MKNIYSTTMIAVALMISVAVTAQVKTPAASPAAKVMQTVGLTDVTLEYSRPSVKGRTIFGDLVEYGKLWRTGANKNSTITFSDNVTVGGKELAKGTYAIFTTPGKTSWKVDFYTDTENWGTPQPYDETKVAASLTVAPMNMGFSVENFSMSIEDLTDNGAVLMIMWDDTAVGVPFTVPTDVTVMANIESVLNGPTASDYFAAGRYYKDSGKDLNKALEYINKSLEMGTEKFWMLRQKALTQAALRDFKGAIDTAEKSMMMAKEAGNSDYVKSNEKSIAEWKTMK